MYEINSNNHKISNLVSNKIHYLYERLINTVENSSENYWTNYILQNE